MNAPANAVHPIIARVAALWRVPVAAVISGGGNDDCERARQDAMALLRAVHHVTYHGLAKRFGVGHLEARAAVRTASARLRHDHRHAANLLQVLLITADDRVAASTGAVR